MPSSTLDHPGQLWTTIVIPSANTDALLSLLLTHGRATGAPAVVCHRGPHLHCVNDGTIHLQLADTDGGRCSDLPTWPWYPAPQAPTLQHHRRFCGLLWPQHAVSQPQTSERLRVPCDTVGIPAPLVVANPAGVTLAASILVHSQARVVLKAGTLVNSPSVVRFSHSEPVAGVLLSQLPWSSLADS